MKTILVSGASGIVGYGILKSLRKSSNEYNLIGTTIYDFSPANIFCDTVKKILPTDDPRYIPNLCEIIAEHDVDMVIPSIECDMYKWNENRAELGSITFPLLNNEHLINLCQDKWLFYEKLVINYPRYAIPTSLSHNNVIPFPLLLKPRHGYGSKGIIRVKNETQLEPHFLRVGTSLMIQPIIGTDDEEYTVSGFFDRNSNLIDYFPLKRKLSINGFTEQAEVADKNFGAVLIDLARTFKPVGPTNFQFRMDGDQPKLLEINPRISSASSIRTAFGYNESDMSLNYFLYNKVPSVLDRSVLMGRRAIRYTEDFIFLRYVEKERIGLLM
jgi:carbamoyl-phosphate synthase large subunit